MAAPNLYRNHANRLHPAFAQNPAIFQLFPASPRTGSEAAFGGGGGAAALPLEAALRKQSCGRRRGIGVARDVASGHHALPRGGVGRICAEDGRIVIAT